MEKHKTRLLDISNTLEFKKMKRLVTNYEPLFYFSLTLPVLALLYFLKFGTGSAWPQILLCAGMFKDFIVNFLDFQDVIIRPTILCLQLAVG